MVSVALTLGQCGSYLSCTTRVDAHSHLTAEETEAMKLGLAPSSSGHGWKVETGRGSPGASLALGQSPWAPSRCCDPRKLWQSLSFAHMLDYYLSFYFYFTEDLEYTAECKYGSKSPATPRLVEPGDFADRGLLHFPEGSL